MNAIIIDDEINAIKSLRWDLEHYVPEVDIIDTFVNPMEALAYLENASIELVFLDIEMPQMNGIDFINSFPDRKFAVIFTTAFSEFALDALKNEAIDYLLKPIDSDDLIIAVEKAKKRLKSNSFVEKIEENLMAFQPKASQENKIKIYHEGQIIFILPEEIVCFKSDGNYTKLVLTKGKDILLSQKLKDLIEKLPQPLFFRSHKSYIINTSMITAYNKNESYVTLNENINVPLSRSNKNLFRDRYL